MKKFILVVAIGVFFFSQKIQAQVNDDLANAIALTMGAPCTGDIYTNVGATGESSEPSGACWYSGDAVQHSVWFTFVAPASGKVAISTDILPGNLADSQIQVFPAPTNVNDLSTLPPAIGCDEDGGIYVPLMSYLELSGLTTGNTYYIQIDGWSGATGTFCITVNENTCPRPNNLSPSNITPTSALLGWTENGTATSWDIEVVPVGSNPTGTPTVSVNSNPYTITGLSPNTGYHFYVRSDCGGGDLSPWIPSNYFYTDCSTFFTSFFEDFNANPSSSTLPECWDEIEPTGTSVGATTALKFDSNISNTNFELFAITPALADLSGGTHQIRFTNSFRDWYSYGILLEVGTMSDPNDPTSFSLVQAIPQSPHEVEISSIVRFSVPTTDTYIAFKVTLPDSSCHVRIDDVWWEPIPSCLRPETLTATNIMPTTADLSWSGSGGAAAWNVELVPAGSPPTGTPTSTGVTNPYTISGLVPDTDYEYYVQADCGGGDLSIFNGPFAFTTPCAALGDFSENFGSVPDYEIPICWNSIENASSSSASFGVATSSASGSYSPPKYLRMYGFYDATAELFAITPELSDLSLGTHQIRFQARVDNNVVFEVGTMNDPTDPTTFTSVQTIPATTNYMERIVFMSAPTTDNYVAFRLTFTDNTGGDVLIDNVFWEPIPSCPQPSSLAVSNITTNSADLSWTDNAGTGFWDIEFGPAGFSPTGIPTTSGVSNPYPKTGLSWGTSYDFYVRADCGGGDTSFWAGPFSFATQCSTFFPGFTEDFTSFVPNCWERADSGTPSTGPSNFGYSSWSQGAFLNTGNNQSAKTTDSSIEDWLISGDIDLFGGPFELVYTIAMTERFSSTPPDISMIGSDDEIRVLISQNGGGSWQTLKIYDQTNPPSALGDLEIIDLTSFKDEIVKIAFWSSCGAVYDPAGVDYDFFVDDISVRVPASCLEPDNLSVTNLLPITADIGWRDNAGANTWEIEYGPAGFALGSGTIIIDADGTPNETLSGLTSNTVYEFYVTAICGPGDRSVTTGPSTFKTLLGCGDNFYDPGGLTGNYGVNHDLTYIFTPNVPGDMVSLNFTAVDLETGFDILKIYNGIGTGGIIMEDELTAPASFTSTDPSGALTVTFTSDSSNSFAGWEAVISCDPPDYVYQNATWTPSDPSGLSTGTDDILILNGTASLTTDTQMNNLTIMSGASVNIEGVLTVNGNITNDGSLIFVNNATKLGQLNDMTGSQILGSGETTVQLYIPARADTKGAYRYLTSAANSSGSIHTNWQEAATGANDDPTPGYGMFITGSISGSNGFDATPTGASSMFYADNVGQAYAAIPNTDVDLLMAGYPYLAYVWGDRSVDIQTTNDPPATGTTLRATGNLAIGNQGNSIAFSVTPNHYNFFGNPYQAIVDMSKVVSNIGSNNLNPNYYYAWDPTIGTRGVFVTVDLSDGSNNTSADPNPSEANQFLQPGQAAFILTGNTGATPSIVFEENDKAVFENPTQVFRPQNSTNIGLQLYQLQDFVDGNSFSDALRIDFSQGESNTVLMNDAVKMANPDENMALMNAGEKLSIAKRALPTDGEILQLSIDQYRDTDYVLMAVVKGLANNMNAFLQDAYANTQTLLSNDSTNLVSFSVDESIPTSMAPDRFSIFFQKKTLSTDDKISNQGFAIYPNPVEKNEFFIVSPGISGKTVELTLYNVIGQQVYNSVNEAGSDGRVWVKNLNLETGVYLMEMDCDGKTHTEKIIVQ